MTIQEFVDVAKQGELKSLAIKSDTAAIVNFINFGLIELYKKFPLNTKEHIVEILEEVEMYIMPSDYMWLIEAYGEVPIDESEDPSNSVNLLPINDFDNPYSVNTVSWNTIQIPANIPGDYVSLVYAAAPTYFTINMLDQQLPIPPQMLEALLYYVSYKGHTTVHGDAQGESAVSYKLYEMSVSRLIKEGMFTADTVNMQFRIEDKGFM